MQFQIIEQCMNMIEQEWKAPRQGLNNEPIGSYQDTYDDISSFSLTLSQMIHRTFAAPTHVTKLAMTWYWLNKLKANY